MGKKKIPMEDYDEVLRRQLEDQEFADEYEALGKEYELAAEFIRLRKERRMTQAEVARRAGTSQPAITRLESGTYRNLSLSFLRRVAKVLRAEPEVHLKRL